MAKYNWKRYWATQEIQLQNYGFLPNPELPWTANAVSFEDIQDVPCLILIGNPGIGKSFAIDDIYESTQQRGSVAIFQSFNECSDFSSFKKKIEKDKNFRAWKTGNGRLHLFLDSLDEGRLEISRVEHSLIDYLETLPCERLSVRITCRSADLPSDLAELLQRIWKQDVKIYQLAQLREKDVYLAAVQENIDPEQFLSAIRQVGAEPLASYPITLNMLVSLYKNNRRLPSSRKELYQDGCDFLARENSESRKEDFYKGEFEATQRLEAARQIAALTILGNRRRIVRKTPEQGDIRLQDCYLPNQTTWAKPEKLLEEALGTALFIAPSPKIHTWAHLSYGEFLAAEYMQRLSLPQIKTLLINPNDPDQKIATQLQETSAWLASMQPDVLEWVWLSEPLILLRSTSIQLSGEQKAELVKSYLEQPPIQRIVKDRSDLERLSYQGLGEQLRPYLANKNLQDEIRDRAMWLIGECKLSELGDSLITLALDNEEKPRLRQRALSVLQHTEYKGQDVKRLRNLLLDQVTANTLSIDMVVYCINLLWPKYLSIDELFRCLPIVFDEQISAIGSAYDSVFRNNLVENIPVNGLVIALNWISDHQELGEDNLPWSLMDFVSNIMRKAWEHLDDDKLLHPFARAAWTRLNLFNPVIGPRYKMWTIKDAYYQEAIDNVPKRHRLIQAMIDVLPPELLVKDSYLIPLLTWPDSDLPFALISDIPWLIEQSLTALSKEKASAYAYLVKRMVAVSNISDWDLVFAAYEANLDSTLAQFVREYFIAIPLNSPSAQQGRENLALQRGLEQQRQSITPIPVRELIDQFLIECELDSVAWIKLCEILLAGEGTSFNLSQWDLIQGYGWKKIIDNKDVITKIVWAAYSFLGKNSPYSGDLEESIPVMNRRFAMEGYRALMLLGSFKALHFLTADDWKRWADAVLFNFFSIPEELLEIDRQLLKAVFAHCPEYALQQLKRRFIYEKNELIFKRFSFAPVEQREQIELDLLESLPSDNDQYVVVLGALLVSTLKNAKVAEIAAIVALRQLAENGQVQRCLGIVLALSHNAQGKEWWPTIWKWIRLDGEMSKPIIEVIAHNGRYLKYLSEQDIYELYLAVLRLYPRQEDIEFPGGLVPIRWSVQRWRDGLLLVIAGRATVEAVQVLERLERDDPQTPGIVGIIEQAKEYFSLKSWIPPDPRGILQLTENSSKRYPRTAEQLSDQVCEALSEIQKEVQWSGGKKSALWDYQKKEKIYIPKAEEFISDVLSDWLRDYLSKTIITRESQPRDDMTKRNGNRIDIQIETFGENNQPLCVIIEVKGCWHPKVFTAMQSQLVDDYLSHNTRCSHGIYLVGYFNSACKGKAKDKADLEHRLNECQSKLSLARKMDIRVVVLDVSPP